MNFCNRVYIIFSYVILCFCFCFVEREEMEGSIIIYSVFWKLKFDCIGSSSKLRRLFLEIVVIVVIVRVGLFIVIICFVC